MKKQPNKRVFTALKLTVMEVALTQEMGTLTLVREKVMVDLPPLETMRLLIIWLR